MANMAQYLADQLLGWLMHVTFAASPTTCYLSLMTTAPALNTAGTEVSGGSYARAAITMGSSWTVIATANGQRFITNSGDISFPAATADWATDAAPIIAWGLRDASSGGNRLVYGLFNEPKAVLNGQTAKVLAGQLLIAVS